MDVPADLESHSQNLEFTAVQSRFYIERIFDFQSLALDLKILIYRRLFPIISSCYNNIDLDYFIQTFEHLTGQLIVLILKEWKTDLDVGFVICATDSVFFLENNSTIENLFKVSFYEFDVLPCYRGRGLGKDLFYVTQEILRKQFSGFNRLSFNHYGNIFYFKLFFESSGYFFPGPFQMPNQNIEKLFHLLKLKYLDEKITEFERFLVCYKVVIKGFDSQKYLSEHLDLDPAQKIFIDLNGFRPGVYLMGLAVHELIPGNSLELQPGNFEKLIQIDYEFRDYFR